MIYFFAALLDENLTIDEYHQHLRSLVGLSVTKVIVASGNAHGEDPPAVLNNQRTHRGCITEVPEVNDRTIVLMVLLTQVYRNQSSTLRHLHDIGGLTEQKEGQEDHTGNSGTTSS